MSFFTSFLPTILRFVGWILSRIGAKKAAKRAYQQAAKASADLGQGSVELNDNDKKQQEDLKAKHDELNK